MADEDADYADEDDFSEEEDGKLQRVEEHSGSTEYLSTEDEGEAGAPAAGAVFASGLDALQLLVVFGVVVLVGVVGVFVSHIFFLRWLYLVMEVVVRPTYMRSTP